MSTIKSKNNMAGAWTNQKKENEKLKSQLLVLETNQNGLRLKLNKNSFFENTMINSENNFRWPILVSEPIITPVVIEEEDEEALFLKQIEEEERIRRKANEARLREIKENKMKKIIDSIRQIEIDSLNRENDRIMSTIQKLQADIAVNNTEIEAVKRGDRDDELIKKQTDNFKITPNVLSAVVIGNQPNLQAEKNKGVRERQIVKRNKLSEVITKTTLFKTNIKDQIKTAKTEDGKTIHADGKIYNSLNKWLDASVREITGDNKTKKSVFEVVLYYNDERKEWLKLGDDYTAETTKLN
jgi:hypothetical protein